MAIIAKACERVSVSLDVYFICKEELRSQGPTLSQAIVDHWFEMDQNGWSTSPLHHPASSLQGLRHKASRLARDLEQKATGRRLILVCQKLCGSILIEALTRKSSTTRGRWLLGRIAGIVFLGPMQLRDCSKRETSVEGLKGSNTVTVHSPERQHSSIFPDRLGHGVQGVEHLPGFINTIIIRLDENPSLTMRRFYASTSLCSRNSSPDRHRTQIMDIRCSREEFSDCRLWSIVRLIQGERLAISGLDAVGSHLNAVALLKLFTCTIKHALNQGGSPTRQDMVSRILSWTAWSMRPLESQEMFAAIATRTTLGVFGRYRSDLHGNLWPATEEDLISFCPEILEIRQGGQVAFRNEQLRLLIRSPLSRDLGFASAEAIHESMAAVCFHHLGCLHKETILRPWINTGSMLRCEIRQCHFRSYCTNYWQDHYRAAEASSRPLVAMLHSTLETALHAVKATRVIDPISRMGTGIWICSLWDLEVLGRTYLEMGADVNYRAGSNEPPLHIAAANASTKMLRLLLDRGASLEVRDCSGFTALQQACEAGASDVVALLLQKGADPESSYDGDKNNTTSIPLNRTPLHLAATSGHLDIVKALLAAGSDLNALTADSRATALHFAVEHGKEDVVRYLIDLGADLEAENSLNQTALETAMQEQRDVMVRLLIDKGAKRLLRTSQDAAYLAKVLGDESPASAIHHFQSLSLENTNVFPYEIPSIKSNVSRWSNETVPEYGWTIIDKRELEA